MNLYGIGDTVQCNTKHDSCLDNYSFSTTVPGEKAVVTKLVHAPESVDRVLVHILFLSGKTGLYWPSELDAFFGRI